MTGKDVLILTKATEVAKSFNLKIVVFGDEPVLVKSSTNLVVQKFPTVEDLLYFLEGASWHSSSNNSTKRV